MTAIDGRPVAEASRIHRRPVGRDSTASGTRSAVLGSGCRRPSSPHRGLRRFERLRFSCALLALLWAVGTPGRLAAQQRIGPSFPAVSEVALRSPMVPAIDTRVAFPAGEVMLRQATAGLVGGLAGALAILLPLAAADRNGDRVSDDAMTVGAILGFLGGSTVGVQIYSNRRGMRGSWWGTLGGATVGALAGPLMPVTAPAGAMAGFNLTRQD